MQKNILKRTGKNSEFYTILILKSCEKRPKKYYFFLHMAWPPNLAPRSLWTAKICCEMKKVEKELRRTSSAEPRFATLYTYIALTLNVLRAGG